LWKRWHRPPLSVSSLWVERLGPSLRARRDAGLREFYRPLLQKITDASCLDAVRLLPCLETSDTIPKKRQSLSLVFAKNYPFTHLCNTL
jgi:hypothetical protein